MKLPTLLMLGLWIAVACGSATAEVYKCTKGDGGVIFSDTPCAVDAEVVEIKSSESTPSNSTWGENQDPKMALVGTWRASIHTYTFRVGGRFRDEQHYGGELIVWRSGNWSLEEGRLTLKYTNSGGQLGAGRMNFSESGTVKWGENKSSFEVTLDGYDYYFSRK